MNFIKDFVILLLSLFGGIASIASIYYFDQQDQGKLALIILGLLLGLSMSHDWYYAHKVRQKERYIHIPEDLNTIYSKIGGRYESVQEITNILASICDATSTIFSEIHRTKIGVCIKLMVEEVSKEAVIVTHVRDQYSISNGRKTGNSENIKHRLKNNSDFLDIYEKLDRSNSGVAYYYRKDVAIDPNYNNSSLSNWQQPTFYWPIFNNIIRKWKWPLPYRSTIVIPIIPLNSNDQNVANLKGFLCLDSKKTNGFNKDLDIEILRGLSGEICPLIDKMNELSRQQ